VLGLMTKAVKLQEKFNTYYEQPADEEEGIE
jgi:hypothetical protein